MKKSIRQMFPDISVEEFDAIQGNHEFSKEYKHKKRKMLREFRRSQPELRRQRYMYAAAAAGVVLALCPIAIKAAKSGELFGRIWGTDGKENISQHDEVIYEDGKEPYTVTYPQKEFEDISPGKAEELVGANMSYEVISKDMNGTTITILATVRDKYAAVVEYTLKKEGGIDTIGYGLLTNEDKGAWIESSAPFRYTFGEGEKTFVDTGKSTEDTLYCYSYVILEPNESDLTLKVCEFFDNSGDMEKAAEESRAHAGWKTECPETDENIVITTIPLPTQGMLADKAFLSQALEDGCERWADVSPIAMNILGVSDPADVYYAEICYKDGSSYIVLEYNQPNGHACETETNNTEFACGIAGTFTLVFNRLVDVENIDYIVINDTAYYPQ